MARLMEWRNPHGKEAFWPINQRPTDGLNFGRHAVKVITTSVALPLLAISAVAETAIYACVCAGVHMTNNRALRQKSTQVLTSSAFTLLWIAANSFLNLAKIDVYSNESMARLYFDHKLGRALFDRPFDQAVKKATELQAFMHHVGRPPQHDELAAFDFFHPQLPAAAPIPARDVADVDASRPAQHPGEANHDQPAVASSNPYNIQNASPSIIEGATFFIDHVVSSLDNDTKDKIWSIDNEVFNFVITRAIGMYIYGDKKTSPIPLFFNDVTQGLIASLGDLISIQVRTCPCPDLVDHLNNFTSSFEQYSRGLEAQLASNSPDEQKEVYREIFHRLGETIHKEYLADSNFMQVWAAAAKAQQRRD